MRVTKPVLLLTGLLLIAPACDAQNCGWSHVDHRVSYDVSGVWNPNVYRGLLGALTVAQIGGAVWEGSETRFGKTMWQGIDSEIIAGVSATAGKHIFTRVRPSDDGQSLSMVPRGVQLQLPEWRGFRCCRAGHSLCARVRQRVSGDLRLASLAARMSARGASRIRRTGKPTCWRAGRWGACPVGTRIAATSRS